MKRFIIGAIAASMLATTGAYADQRPARQDIQVSQNNYGYDNSNSRKIVKKKVVIQKKVIKKQRWGKGQRMANWKRHRAVRDYGRYGLRKPGRGQQWIKVDNDYILIAITSGVIASVLVGR